jgi:hypothetical protein
MISKKNSYLVNRVEFVVDVDFAGGDVASDNGDDIQGLPIWVGNRNVQDVLQFCQFTVLVCKIEMH